MKKDLVSKSEFIRKVEESIKKREAPFSIAIVDIDNFENINKIYGYTIGDEVLNKLYSIFRQNTGKEDIITKSGDEFNILLVEKGSERSFMEMEEIRRYLSDNTFLIADNSKSENVYVTFSCGIASFPRDAKKYN
jgi:diguanylate cyclase (GGDEF)-like protein